MTEKKIKAKQIEELIKEFKEGDRVVIKYKHYTGMSYFPGVVLSVENFENSPRICVSYIYNKHYDTPKVDVAHITQETLKEGADIIVSSHNDLNHIMEKVEENWKGQEERAKNSLLEAMLSLENIRKNKNKFAAKYEESFLGVETSSLISRAKEEVRKQ